MADKEILGRGEKSYLIKKNKNTLKERVKNIFFFALKELSDTMA